MSTWLFDLGNSRLKFAPLLDDGSAGEVVAVAHDGNRFEAGWEAALPAGCTRACVAGVGPDPVSRVLQATLSATCRSVEWVRTEPECDGVRIAYAEPARLGVDRFLALLAAHARCDMAVLVVGVGTALTIDLLAAGGRHLGGRIAPSPMLMREALHTRSTRLPVAGGDYVAFAGDTADALASGCEGAALALVERSLAEAAAMIDAPASLLVHGGGAPALLPRLPTARHAPALVLEGLARWAARPR